MHHYLRIKILMLIFVLFMFSIFQIGCGSGGNHTSSASGTSTGGSGSGNNPTYNDTANPGYLAIDFAQGTAQTVQYRSMSSNPATLSNPSNVRIVITNYANITSTDPDSGDTIVSRSLIYKKIVNVATGTTTSIPVAPGTGYKVDVISYRFFTDHNTMYKYGVANAVDVVSGQTTNISLTLNPIDANLQVLGSIPSGSIYTVTSNPSYPLRTDKKFMRTPTITPINDVFTDLTGTTSFTFTAPVLAQTASPIPLYLQGLFLLSADLLDTNESATLFRYYEPNPSELIDSQVTATVVPPGSVGITITL